MIDFNLPQKIHSFVEQQFSNYSETATEYSVYCPFHNNTDTPALYINKNSGLWICFNPACGKKGNIHKLAEYFGVAISTKFVKKDISVDELISSLVQHHEHISYGDWDEALDRIAIDYDDIANVTKLEYLIETIKLLKKKYNIIGADITGDYSIPNYTGSLYNQIMKRVEVMIDQSSLSKNNSLTNSINEITNIRLLNFFRDINL